MNQGNYKGQIPHQQAVLLMQKVQQIQFPTCNIQGHHKSQLNEFCMDVRCNKQQQLQPCCCVCRLQNNHQKDQHWVMPIVTVLCDLLTKLEAEFQSSEVLKEKRSQNIEHRFKELSKDFKLLSIQCDKMSKDILSSFDNYRAVMQKEVENVQVKRVITNLISDHSEDNLRRQCSELQDFTVNMGNCLSLDRSRTQSYQDEVQQNAEMYLQTMNDIVKKLFGIIGEIQEYSLIQPNDLESQISNSQLRSVY